MHLLARQPIDPDRPHPFTAAGNTEFNCLLWMPPNQQRAGDIVLVDSTNFTTLFGGTESLAELLAEFRPDEMNAGTMAAWIASGRTSALRRHCQSPLAHEPLNPDRGDIHADGPVEQGSDGRHAELRRFEHAGDGCRSHGLGRSSSRCAMPGWSLLALLANFVLMPLGALALAKVLWLDEPLWSWTAAARLRGRRAVLAEAR